MRINFCPKIEKYVNIGLFNRHNRPRFAPKLVCAHLMELMESGEFSFSDICSFSQSIGSVIYFSHLLVPYLCSIGIESVVDENTAASAGLHSDAKCNACEMAVVWMQNQLTQNQTAEHILNYIDQVRLIESYTFLIVLLISSIYSSLEPHAAMRATTKSHGRIICRLCCDSIFAKCIVRHR